MRASLGDARGASSGADSGWRRPPREAHHQRSSTNRSTQKTSRDLNTPRCQRPGRFSLCLSPSLHRLFLSQPLSHYLSIPLLYHCNTSSSLSLSLSSPLCLFSSVLSYCNTPETRCLNALRKKKSRLRRAYWGAASPRPPDHPLSPRKLYAFSCACVARCDLGLLPPKTEETRSSRTCAEAKACVVLRLPCGLWL